MAAPAIAVVAVAAAPASEPLDVSEADLRARLDAITAEAQGGSRLVRKRKGRVPQDNRGARSHRRGGALMGERDIEDGRLQAAEQRLGELERRIASLARELHYQGVLQDRTCDEHRTHTRQPPRYSTRRGRQVASLSLPA